MRIGVIGCGMISSAAVHGIARDGHQILVSERSATYARALADAYENVTISDNQGVVDASDVIFLALIAEVAPDVLGALRFRGDQRIITFMAGATLEQADAMVRPARAVAIMMPFPGISKGGTPIMMQGDPALVDEIFGARNEIYPLKDAKEMAAYLCAQAVLSPVARMVNDTAEWLGKRVSDKAQGEAFLRALIASNLSDTESAALIKALNTPGGYNQRLRLHMEASGSSEALTGGLNALE
ncbi:NAD(P)-binding domain-containing protein [Pseudorhodobacter sp. W20_MBD10_FR17]|uniref:NAD(P)-binding domain-containing protein n=1 Tax=Pseudorhodobacter sp. W20_MBD10_FR17 TaxID=3240266 RepID=UPI003F995F90